jgi:hypothetical protein
VTCQRLSASLVLSQINSISRRERRIRKQKAIGHLHCPMLRESEREGLRADLFLKRGASSAATEAL